MPFSITIPFLLEYEPSDSPKCLVAGSVNKKFTAGEKAEFTTSGIYRYNPWSKPNNPYLQGPQSPASSWAHLQIRFSRHKQKERFEKGEKNFQSHMSTTSGIYRYNPWSKPNKPYLQGLRSPASFCARLQIRFSRYEQKERFKKGEKKSRITCQRVSSQRNSVT